VRLKKVSWAIDKVNVPGVSFKHYETETAFQIYCADWLRKQAELTGNDKFKRWHHSANERVGAKAGLTVKLMGQQKGFPDFIHLQLKIAVEFKIKNRALSVEQKDWAEYFRSIGWQAFTCYNFETFKRILGC
jgi:hypothetical protein